MKKMLTTLAAAMVLSGVATASGEDDSVRLGVLLGFTGPAESLAPGMAEGVALAINEVNASGNLFGGVSVDTLDADSTCTDTAAATAAAERLIITEGVDGVIGGLCSSATIAALNNVAVPNGMVMISPSATSPQLTSLPDDGLFFRVAPSDARQGVVMAEVILDRGISEVAVSYTDNHYGRGLADSFQRAFEAAGGEVTRVATHGDIGADHTVEADPFGGVDGDALVVIGYDQGGPDIIRAALDTGAFDTFVLPDAMVSPAMMEAFGTELDGSFGQIPGTDSEGVDIYTRLADGAGFDGASAYSGESYDAAAVMLLAMQAAGSRAPADYARHVIEVTNAPGTPILPGELGRALELLAAGEDIDYIGATNVEMVEPGEVPGSYREFIINNGEYSTVRFR